MVQKQAVADADSADYRHGLAASHRGDLAAAAMLDAALGAALAAGDRRHAAMASAALLIEGQLRSTFRGFRDHIGRLAIARDARFRWRSLDDELLALSGLLIGLLFIAAADPFIDACAARVMTLIESDVDPNLAFAAGRIMLFYCQPREMQVLEQRVYATLKPSMQAATLTPHRLAHFLMHWARVVRYARDKHQADRAVHEVRRLTEAHGLDDIRFWLAFADVEQSLPSRNVVEAERALAVAESFADPAHLGELARLESLKTKVATLKGQGDRAVVHAARATGYARELEHPPPVLAVYLVSEAQARLALGESDMALALMREAAPLVPLAFADEVRDMIALIEADVAIAAGHAEGRDKLAAAWAAMRGRRFYDTFDGYPAFGARLCALALAHGIEVDFVRSLIDVRGIAAPADAPDAWPWPIRIEAFGGFTVYRRGEPLAFEGKAQKKPIELLQVLAALGGRAVGKDLLRAHLWPEAADTAPAALDVLVSRARKLLDDPLAIRVEEGRIGFDPSRVWLDVWAFDRDVEALQAALRPGAAGAAIDIDALAQRLVARYRGPFLGNAEPSRWSLPARDRWQNRLRRSLADVGRHYAERGDHARAAALYERVLEEDSLAEELYRRLMRAYLALGEPAEAARVYRRCRDMLSVQLGIPPSAETEAVFRSIYSR
ncbi:MAG TPA: BTAD domain-containing putative transcriptional regulator [Casimicrobiaceae bacterium]|jgi:DNA-binding SARP family transcriptional activator|nr:BTAD domain-containing putative transcriptional regulator [Casimicrobiaceae bacterium]